MRGYASEHWVTLIGFTVIGEIALGTAVTSGWLPSLDDKGMARSMLLTLAFAPVVIGLLANRRALPVVLTVFIPAVAIAYFISQSCNWMLVSVVIISSLIASGIWGRIFLAKARRYFDINRCEQCSYDLAYNATGRCPECGKVILKWRSDFPGFRNCVRRPKFAIILFLVVPSISSIVSMRYARPYEWQLEDMVVNNDLIGMTPTRLNWTIGSSIPSDVSDGKHAVYMPHAEIYGLWFFITTKDGVVVKVNFLHGD